MEGRRARCLRRIFVLAPGESNSLDTGAKDSCSPVDLRSFVKFFLLPILSFSKCSSKIFIPI